MQNESEIQSILWEEPQKLVEVYVIHFLEDSEPMSLIWATMKNNKNLLICLDSHRLDNVIVRDPSHIKFLAI